MTEQELQAIPEVPTDEEIFVAWRKVINRNRSALRNLTDKLGACAREKNKLQAEVRRLQAQLAAVPVDALNAYYLGSAADDSMGHAAEPIVREWLASLGKQAVSA